MKIKVVYCSNYNGVCLSSEDGQKLDEDKEADVETTIADKAVEFCSEDGRFYGDIEDLEEFAVSTVKEHFGDDVEVLFAEDSISS